MTEFHIAYALVSLKAVNQCSPNGDKTFVPSGPTFISYVHDQGLKSLPTPEIEMSPALLFCKKSEYLTVDRAAQMYSSNRKRRSSSLPRNLIDQSILSSIEEGY